MYSVEIMQQTACTLCFTCHCKLDVRSPYLLDQILLWDAAGSHAIHQWCCSRFAAKTSIWPLKLNYSKSKHKSRQISAVRLDPVSYRCNSEEKASSWQRQMGDPSPCFLFIHFLLTPFKPMFSCQLSLMKLSTQNSKLIVFNSFLSSWPD